MNVYIVTTGEYSDYSVWGIFDSEEVAAGWVEKLSLGSYSDRADYFEMPVLGSDWQRVAVYRIGVRLNDAGERVQEWDGVSLTEPGQGLELGPIFHTNSWGTTIMYYFLEEDRERALKAHRDLVAKKRAEIIGL